MKLQEVMHYDVAETLSCRLFRGNILFSFNNNCYLRGNCLQALPQFRF